MFLRTATVTSKGRVTIPKEIREFLKLFPGDELVFVMGNAGNVTIIPKTRDIYAAKGLLHQPEQPIISVEQMNKEIKKRRT